MKTITIHNYEAYLLDYSEGNLTNDLCMELEAFVILHPELEIHLNELELISIEADETTFSQKNNLKKTEADGIVEEHYISYIENQLSENDKINFEKLINQSSTATKELALYKKTTVSPDTTIVFNQKNELKRKPKIIWFNFSTTQYSIAASIVLLLGVFWIFNKNVNTKEIANTQLAVNPSIKHFNERVKRNNQNANQNKTDSNQSEIKKQKSAIIKSKKNINTSATVIEPLIVNQSENQDKENTNNAINQSSIIVEVPQQAIAGIKPADKTKTVVQVISEDEDTEPIAVKSKKGFWNVASKTLNNINKLGIKQINGSDKNNDVDLTLGGLSVTHKTASNL